MIGGAFDDHVTVVAVSVYEALDRPRSRCSAARCRARRATSARTGSMKVSESSPASMSSEYEVSVGGVRSFV